MRLLTLLSGALLAIEAPLTTAASGWGFADASVSIQTKGAGVGGGLKEKFTESSAVSDPISFGAQDTLKVLLTVQDGKTAKRAHQAFLNLQDHISGLETSFPLSVKDSGKAKVELTHKDIPLSLLRAPHPLTASIVIGSFGSSKPLDSKAFSVAIKLDVSSPAALDTAPPLRYGKMPEIHHIFKPDPKSPPMVVSLFFTAAVLVALPALFGTWVYLGANTKHLPKALNDAPISHVLFYGSVAAMEGVFFMYYTTWNLFRILPLALGIGAVIFLSGTRALTEVQGRRLAGKL